MVRGTASLAYRHPARVRLLAPLSVLAERVPPAGGLLVPDGDGACVLETGGDSLRDLVAYLTHLDVDFEVLDPPELRELLRQLAARYTAAARNPE